MISGTICQLVTYAGDSFNLGFRIRGLTVGKAYIAYFQINTPSVIVKSTGFTVEDTDPIEISFSVSPQETDTNPAIYEWGLKICATGEEDTVKTGKINIMPKVVEGDE